MKIGFRPNNPNDSTEVTLVWVLNSLLGLAGGMVAIGVALAVTFAPTPAIILAIYLTGTYHLTIGAFDGKPKD